MDARTLHKPEAGDRLGLAALAALPLLLLAIDSDWIFSGPHRDAWIYYGYFENAVYLLRRFQDFYYSSRLAVILPGFALHHLLPPLWANLALHLAIYWVVVMSFYLAVKKLFGARVALLTGFALGCHPHLLKAVGWNYVDGFGAAYFLVGLLLVTLAAESPSWRPLLVLAGAMATAIASTNLFYVVYLPVLAGHFIVLNRQRGRRVPLLAGALWASLGAIGLFVLFGSFTWGLGKDFLYLRSSLQFARASIGTPNIFRDPTYSWLADAVWLVFPIVVFVNGLILLGRAWRDPSLRKNGLLLWSQAQFFFLALWMVFFQAAGGSVLQYFYYATLLIPSAFLAFAAQVSLLMVDLPRRRFAALAAAVALLQIVPLCLPLTRSLSATSTLFPATLLLALPAGLGIAIVLARRAAGTRAVALVFLCLALSQLLVRQGGTIFRNFERHGSDGRGLFLQLSRAVTSIGSFDPSQNARLWYNWEEEYGKDYDSVGSAFLLCPRLINLGFPNLPDARMCDGVQLGPGVPVAILSADPAAYEKADTAIRGIGLSTRFLKREEIEGPSPGFAITYLRTEAGAAP
ncbi:MAG TPA: hypothetical protein VF179_14175 [Thermoanaerobaculia bacterium]|nr:hypothetical protein [Thermoanaerobaculia bacterium]